MVSSKHFYGVIVPWPHYFSIQSHLTVGFGISNIGSFSTTSDPGLYVFTRFLGPIGAILLIVFTINSYLSNGVAKTNAVSRVWFSASRDKIIFPKSFSEVHKKYKSPYKAIRGYMILMLIINLLFGFLFGPKTGDNLREDILLNSKEDHNQCYSSNSVHNKQLPFKRCCEDKCCEQGMVFCKQG